MDTLEKNSSVTTTGRGRSDGRVVEISLLLPGCQATALENLARQRGLTAGQVVRQLIRDFCAEGEEFSLLDSQKERELVGESWA